VDVEAARALAPWMSALATGLAFGGLALAVYLTFRVLDFPDLTVDGSLGFGAAITAALIQFGHWNPWLTLLAAGGAGALAGLATGLLHTGLKINGLLASILVAISLFTINLRVMHGSDLSLFDANTLFAGANGDVSTLETWLAPFGAFAARSDFRASVVLLLLTALIIMAAYWWLNSEQGLALRATGDNAPMIRAQGTNTDRMKILGLMVANGLCGLSGALLAQQLGFADINLGPGSILTGLAAVILGEAVFRGGGVLAGLVGAVVGSILFQLILALTQVQFTLASTDYKLASALIVLIALLISALRGRLGLRRLTRPRRDAVGKAES